jgi:hypothetical protein
MGGKYKADDKRKGAGWRELIHLEVTCLLGKETHLPEWSGKTLK